MDSSITTLSQIKKSDISILKKESYKKSRSIISSYYRVVGREDNWQASFKTIRQIIMHRVINGYGFNPGPKTSIAKFVDFWETLNINSWNRSNNYSHMSPYRKTCSREGIPISSWRIQ